MYSSATVPEAKKHDICFIDWRWDAGPCVIEAHNDDEGGGHKDDRDNDEDPRGHVEYHGNVPDRRKWLRWSGHPDCPIQPNLEGVVNETGPLMIVADCRHTQVTVSVAHLIRYK